MSLVAAEAGWRMEGDSARRRRVVNSRGGDDFEKYIIVGAMRNGV